MGSLAHKVKGTIFKGSLTTAASQPSLPVEAGGQRGSRTAESLSLAQTALSLPPLASTLTEEQLASRRLLLLLSGG